MIRLVPFFLLLLVYQTGLAQNWQELNTQLESFYQAGDYQKSLTVAEKALEQARLEFGENHKNYAEALYQLAYVQHTLGNYPAAEKNYQSALSLRKNFTEKDQLDYVTTLKSLGELYGAMNKFPEAEPLLKEAIRQLKVQTGDNNADYADALMTLGVLYRRMQLLDQAEPIELEAVQVIKKLAGEKSEEYARFLYELALLYDWKAFREKSDELRKKSAALYEQVLAIRQHTLGRMHPRYANVLKGLAVLYAAMRQYPKSDSLYRETIAIYREKKLDQTTAFASIASDYAQLCLETQRLAEAEQWLEAVLKIRSQKLNSFHSSYIGSLSLLGDVYYNMGRYGQAEKRWIEVNHRHQASIRYNFPTLTETERVEFYVTAQRYFEPFLSFATQADRSTPQTLAEAYNTQLQTKGLLLQSAYRMQQVATQLSDSARPLFAEWQTKKSNIAKFYNLPAEQQQKSNLPVRQWEQEAEDLEKRLSYQSAPFARSLTQTVTWTQVKQRLKPNEAAIELVRFRKYRNTVPRSFTDTVYYAALIITPDAQVPQLVLLTNGNDLEGIHLRSYRHQLQHRLTDNDSYRQYWLPIRQALAGIKTVYLSPDGVYNLINLQTLRNPETGKYLLEEHTVRIVTSTRDLLPNPARTKRRSIALFGFPDYYASTAVSKADLSYGNTPENIELERGDTFSPLPGSKTEAERISRMTEAKGWKTQVFMAEQASEENVKNLTRPGILHIATHGYFQSALKGDLRNPLLRSGLLLAGAADTTRQVNLQAEDGILTAYEASGLSLDGTQLVVLSACETGLGEVRNGEGVYGMQRAFTVAGAQSVLMSLWKVNDQVTQQLMEAFYRNWLRGRTPAEALRRAQARIRRRSALSHPYYWGSFVLTGI